MYKLYSSSRLIKMLVVIELLLTLYFSVSTTQMRPLVVLELLNALYPISNNIVIQLMDTILSAVATFTFFIGLIAVLLDKFALAKWLILIGSLIFVGLVLIEQPYIVYGATLFAKELSLIVQGLLIGLLFFPQAGSLANVEDL